MLDYSHKHLQSAQIKYITKESATTFYNNQINDKPSEKKLHVDSLELDDKLSWLRNDNRVF